MSKTFKKKKTHFKKFEETSPSQQLALLVEVKLSISLNRL